MWLCGGGMKLEDAGGVGGISGLCLTYPSAERHRLPRGRQVSTSSIYGAFGLLFQEQSKFSGFCIQGGHSSLITGKYSQHPRIQFLQYKVLQTL